MGVSVCAHINWDQIKKVDSDEFRCSAVALTHNMCCDTFIYFTRLSIAFCPLDVQIIIAKYIQHHTVFNGPCHALYGTRIWCVWLCAQCKYLANVAYSIFTGNDTNTKSQYRLEYGWTLSMVLSFAQHAHCTARFNAKR